MNKFFALLTVVTSFGVNAQMNGAYTVGGVAPDFTTIGAACAQIEAQGISGPVTIEIRDGVYYDSIYLTSVTGVSAVNTITFQSESQDNTSVEITNGNQSPVYLSGPTVDYISVRYLTLTTTGLGSVVEVRNGVNDFQLSNCIVNGYATTFTQIGLSAVYATHETYDNDRITITNNVINNGSYGIHFRNNQTILAEVTIVDNIIHNSYWCGIYTEYVSELIISGNKIDCPGPSQIGGKGIQVYEFVGNMLVEGNEIYRTNQDGGDGIYMEYLDGSATIRNNIISMPGVSSSAVYTDYMAAEIYYYNNSFRVGGDVFRGYYDNELEVFNNVLISASGGHIYNIDYNSISIPPLSMNNACYTNGDFATVAFPYFQTYPTLNDYESSFGNSTNSFELIDFQFVHDTLDLHTCKDSLIGSGIAVSSVLFDVDGEPRSQYSPSIGADYFQIDGSVWNGNDLETCAGVPVVLDAGAADSYLWSTTEDTQTISAANFGQYTVEGTNVCGTFRDTVIINDITPVASFTQVQSFLTFQFTNTSQNATSYLWDFGDGNTSTEMNPVHVYSDINTYTVTLTVTNACGSDVRTLQVTPSVVGIDELSTVDLELYPNPATDKFTVRMAFDVSGGVELIITDINGTVVMQKLTTDQVTELELSNLAKGTYIVSISGEKFSTQNRLIKL